MLDHVREEHFPAADLARAVNGILGTDTISTVTIRQWKRRGHIVATGADDKGRPTSLVSDVVNRALGVTPNTAPMSHLDGKINA